MNRLSLAAALLAGLSRTSAQHCSSEAPYKCAGLPAVTVDAAALSATISRLATFSDAEAPAVTRVVYTPQDLAARGCGLTILTLLC